MLVVNCREASRGQVKDVNRLKWNSFCRFVTLGSISSSPEMSLEETD